MSDFRTIVLRTLGHERAYERMDAFEKCEHLEQLLAREEEAKALDPPLVRRLMEEYHYWRWQCVLVSPQWDIERHAYIKPGDGKATLIRPYHFQQAVLDKIIAKQKLRKACFLIIIKSKKLGFSTLVGCHFETQARTHEGRDAVVVAHTDRDAVEIFERIYKTLVANDPLIAHPLESDRENRIVFADPPNGSGSRITVVTAGGRMGLGRGRTTYYGHLSEMAFWPRSTEHATYNGLMNSMAKPPEPIVVIIETTGNGQMGLAFQKALRAYRSPEDSEWELVFVPWFDDPASHEMKFDTPEAKRKFTRGLSERDKLLIERYGVTVEQLHYYHWTYRNKIEAATEEERRRKHKAEYPSDFMEAFQASGASTFDAEKIGELLTDPRCGPPKERLELVAPPLWDATAFAPRPDTPEPEPHVRADGKLHVWERPTLGHRYAMGVDFARGEERGNYSVVMVLDRDARKFVAMYRARARLHEMHVVVRLMSRWYHDAVFCPESNSYGGVFIEAMARTDRAQFMYVQRSSRHSVGEEPREQYGWLTTDNSKALMVGMLDSCVYNEPGLFTVPALLEEMLTFRAEVSEATGRTLFKGATRKNETDDIVVASALALFCAQDMPLLGPAPEEPEEPKKLTVKMLMQMARDSHEEEQAPVDYTQAMGWS